MEAPTLDSFLFNANTHPANIAAIFFYQIGSADKDTPYEPQEPRWPYQPTDQTPPPPNRPEQYKVAIGDRTKISCQIENQNKRTSWRRQDGGELPRNSHLSGGDLIIEYTQEDAAGVYECVVHEANEDYPIVTTELVIVGKLFRPIVSSSSIYRWPNLIDFRHRFQNCQGLLCIRRCRWPFERANTSPSIVAQPVNNQFT